MKKASSAYQISAGSYFFNSKLIMQTMQRRTCLNWLAAAATVPGITGISGLGLGHAWAADTPPHAPALLLAQVYRRGTPLADYWVSEKYDGVRGYWDGQRLRTRRGEVVHAPDWFTAGWPEMPLEGELWAGRGQFALAQSTARTQRPDDQAWRKLQFMAFDLPSHSGTFDERLSVLRTAVEQINHAWVQAVSQQRVSNHEELHGLLQRVVSEGGEGLMLHRGSSLYQSGRSDDLLKFKTHDDAEARVIAHLPGTGKYAGKVGALLVETPSGQRFKLGTGLKDSDRANPPPVGSWVTYRFRGAHNGGVPRFASYVRPHPDM